MQQFQAALASGRDSGGGYAVPPGGCRCRLAGAMAEAEAEAVTLSATIDEPVIFVNDFLCRRFVLMSSPGDGGSPPGRGKGIFRGRGRVAGVGNAPVGRGETTPAARIVGRARGRGRGAIALPRPPGSSGQLPIHAPGDTAAIAASPSLVVGDSVDEGESTGEYS